jgi:hypothetical protein
MCLIPPLRIDLGRSNTYSSRLLTWVRNTDPAALADGRMRLDMRKAKSESGKVETEEYDVAEQQERFPGARVFQCVKLSDGEVREVTIGDRGDLCTCEAGRARLQCKHTVGLRAVVDEGGLSPLPLPARVVLPVVCCLICGEQMGREDGEVHEQCERFAESQAKRERWRIEVEAEIEALFPAKCSF